MDENLLLPILFMTLGLLVGGLLGWLLRWVKIQSAYLSRADLEKAYLPRQIVENLQQQSDLLRDDLMEKEERLHQTHALLAAREQVVLNLEEKLNTLKLEAENWQQRAQADFENLANRLLEEKSQKFSTHNQQQLQEILHPLREKIKTFEEGIEKRFVEETRDRVSLKKEIEQLRELNQQLSHDANNLANALKGDNKAQGNWGELQLERLLEKAGLTKGIHYHPQPTYTDPDGAVKRPDFVVHLPGNKHLVVDSKVSLLAYDLFFKSTDPTSQQKHLNSLSDSIRKHVKDLSDKNYQHLYQINAPDYLLLFIPIEPAFAAALQHDGRLFTDALDRNVVIVTTTTLLATMRTVAYIWKQEKQQQNVLEIARQSGLLYDKFVSFIEDLQTIGQRLGMAQNAWSDAMRKLNDSRKYGDTLVGRAQRIKELGAKTSKSLPEEWEAGQ